MTDLETWFNQYFWPTYPADLTHKKKGPKSVALKSIVKLNPDENMRLDIMAKLEVLIRSARAEKRVGKEPDRWPFASTWINQERWNCIEDIQATTELQTNSRTCACGAKVTHINKCDRCAHGEIDKKHDQMLLGQLDKLGLGKPAAGASHEQVREWQQRCREYGRPVAARILAGATQR